VSKLGIRSLDALPWFADDDAIGVALLGPGRVAEWKAIAELLERKGLPKVDPYLGGRYMPAVKAFFDRQYGIGHTDIYQPEGLEDLSVWKRTPKGRRHRA
jgi:hypothetical protein